MSLDQQCQSLLPSTYQYEQRTKVPLPMSLLLILQKCPHRSLLLSKFQLNHQELANPSHRIFPAITFNDFCVHERGGETIFFNVFIILFYTIRKGERVFEMVDWHSRIGHFKSWNSTSKAMITRVVFLMQLAR